MDISFYVLLTLACMVLLLAMWACAASGTSKWGPDLTLELPPHLLQEALFGLQKKAPLKPLRKAPPLPSAPTELPSAPLLCNEQHVGLSSSLKSFNPSIAYHTDTIVRVLPPRYEPMHKVKPPVPPRYQPIHQVKPVVYKFSTEDPV